MVGGFGGAGGVIVDGVEGGGEVVLVVNFLHWLQKFKFLVSNSGSQKILLYQLWWWYKCYNKASPS